jgi:hypothetical protein
MKNRPTVEIRNKKLVFELMNEVVNHNTLLVKLKNVNL